MSELLCLKLRGSFDVPLSTSHSTTRFFRALHHNTQFSTIPNNFISEIRFKGNN